MLPLLDCCVLPVGLILLANLECYCLHDEVVNDIILI